MVVKLTKPPVVRRLNYINDYMEGVKKGLDKEELEERLVETKKRLETEKALAVGRGNPFSKNISKTSYLTYDCKRITFAMQFIEYEPIILTELGEKYLQASDPERKNIICEAYSKAYPHFGELVRTLQKHGTMVLPMRNKPEFRPEIQKYGLDMHQVAFDTVRDLATDVGLINWYTKGSAEKRRQFVYLVCCQVDSLLEAKYTVYYRAQHLYLKPNKVSNKMFRDSLWDNYLECVNGIPGAPVFYSELRMYVCYDLKISDSEFNKQILGLFDDDEKLNVIWSQGTLPRKRDSASMLKSLPPKNEDGNYIIYLKIVRKR